MKLQELIKDPRNSLVRNDDLDGAAYGRIVRHLARYRFWPGSVPRARKLWSHQVGAIGLAAGYLTAERALPAEGITNEAALIKMATGTGKSAVITVLARCLPQVRRVLILTPREALTDQLYRYVRAGFWTTMGYAAAAGAVFDDESGEEAGAPVQPAYVAKLLPGSVTPVLHAAETEERLVLVGTLQALDQIRRRAARVPRDPAEMVAAQSARDMLSLIGSFDLIIVDEGHYEPAISWSRAIRDADLPTILFSATPYRNDYKSFRVRGRFVFNQSIHEALAAKVIRQPVFQALGSVEEATGEPVVVRAAGRNSEDTDRVNPLTPRDRTDATGFARALAAAVRGLPAFHGLTFPKVIVRADDRAKLELLQSEIEAASGERALIIHHGVDRNDQTRRRYNSVRAAQARPENAAVRYWLHQTKLLEGVDDPSFVAVAVYDGFGNARQLIQQTGRVLRSSDPKRRATQGAYVWASAGRLADAERTWRHYLEFETYCAENTRHVVTNEAALPDRLLRDMPDLQYVEGEFRPRFMLEGTLTQDDIRLPASAAVFDFVGASFDKEAMRREMAEAILNRDRFQPIDIAGLPDHAVGLAYYGWRTSPLLTRQFFPEWTLGVCVMVRVGDLVLAHDTEGIVFDGAKLGLGRMDRGLLSRAIPGTSSGAPVRVARMSTASLDMSESAIRSQATRTRSFETTFTDLLDPGMVPTSAYGFIQGRGRYLGFARARIRDSFEQPLMLADYVRWAESVCEDLRNETLPRNPVFNRYALVAGELSEDEADPKSVLLDLGDSFNEFLDENDDAGMRRSLIDADHADLCADVHGGQFEITIDGQQFEGTIEFVKRTRRYRISSGALDSYFKGRSSGAGRRAAATFTQLLNRAQAFRVIPKAPGVVYAGGTFHRPRGFEPRADGTVAQLQNVVVVPALADIKTEKGENLYFSDRPAWETGSCFGLIEAMAEHPAGSPMPEAWGDLGALVTQFDLIVCDDDGQEVGDFLAIDTAGRRACIIHAKAASKLHQDSIAGLEAVGRQALASLASCATTAEAPLVPDGRWDTDVRANTVTLTGRSRIFKNSQGLDSNGIVSSMQEALTNRAWSREIWIMAARLLDRRHVEASVRARRTNRNWQLLMYLESLTTACARGNARLRIFCHASPDPAATPARRRRRAAAPAV
jgi:superfamily II DNA or RNA helicase